MAHTVKKISKPNAKTIDDTKQYEKELGRTIPPHISKALITLKAHENKILTGLNANDEIKMLFLQNPVAALTKLNIPIPPILKTQMKTASMPSSLFVQRKFQLPNGQVITPKINIKFTQKRRIGPVDRNRNAEL